MQPADDEHPYGHRQLESIAALVVGAFVLTTAVAIFWDAVNKVYDLLSGQGDFGGASVGALVVALLTVVIKIGLDHRHPADWPADQEPRRVGAGL